MKGPRPLVPFAFLLAACVAGCFGASGPQRGAVHGKVTLDGQPIARGSIAFCPTAQTTGPVAGGRIANGQYQITRDRGPVVGTHRVEINATRKTGRKVAAGMSGSDALVDEIVEAVPRQYNIESTLTCDIAAGENSRDFSLTSR